MLLLSDRLIGIPLMSLQTGGPVAETAEPIIDPRQLYITAFYCEGPFLDTKPSVIYTTDIREVSDLGLIIDSSDTIMDPTDLLRLQEVIGFEFELIDTPVVDDRGQKLGKVIDYATDMHTFMVQKLHVRPPLMQSFGAAELMIDRAQVIEVTNKQIVVKSPSVEAEEKGSAATVRELTTNPFRNPQIESIKQD
jgi:sporulation protein YlmC with PRC-barrel domain